MCRRISTTGNPIIANGLVPVFIDCELNTFNINTKNIEEAISHKTRAIMVAHTLETPSFRKNKKNNRKI